MFSTRSRRRERPVPARGHNQGVVLISVLLIFAATTVLVVALQVKFQNSARLQGLMQMDAQAKAYLHGAELLAGQYLLADALSDLEESATADHRSEPWAQRQTFPIDGGEIRTQLIDLQGRLNITGLLTDQKVQTAFVQLLRELQIPKDSRVSPEDRAVLSSTGAHVRRDLLYVGRFAQQSPKLTFA